MLLRFSHVQLFSSHAVSKILFSSFLRQSKQLSHPQTYSKDIYVVLGFYIWNGKINSGLKIFGTLLPF